MVFLRKKVKRRRRRGNFVVKCIWDGWIGGYGRFGCGYNEEKDEFGLMMIYICDIMILNDGIFGYVVVIFLV
jgi:hypothetical protein